MEIYWQESVGTLKFERLDISTFICLNIGVSE